MMDWSMCRVLTGAVLCSTLSVAMGCALAVSPPDGEHAVATKTHAGAAKPASAIVYPNALHGLWVGEHSTCPPSGGEFDGELILEISADRIVGYEEVQKPLSVTPLSGQQGWRVESLLDIGPSDIFGPNEPQVFVLDDGTLTITSGTNIERYRHCSVD